MLFRFGDGLDEFSIGATATDESGDRFEAGTQHKAVKLAFWAEEADRVIRADDSSWCGTDGTLVRDASSASGVIRRRVDDT
jgi:hypothetical protein